MRRESMLRGIDFTRIMHEAIKFIAIPLIIWTISQSIKFAVHAIKHKSLSRDKLFWIYCWAGGAPSTHSAMLTSSLYLLGVYHGLDAVFGFAFIVVLLLMYNLAADRKKQELFEQHLKNSKDTMLKRIINGTMLDMSGHTVFEILTGAAFGVLMAIALVKVF